MKLLIQDVIDYWNKELFPEFKSISELNDHLYEMLGEKVETLADKYLSENANEPKLYKELKKREVFTDRIKENIPLYNVFAPIAITEIEKFNMYLEKYNIIENKDYFIDRIILQLLDNLSKVATRTMVLELNIAREERKLVGDSSEERYNYFINSYLSDKDNLEKLYQRYPVLYQLLLEQTKDYFQFIRQILTDWIHDKSMIEDQFGIKNLLLKDIEIGLGDKHAGKSAAKIYLSDGKKLIYKPKNMNAEVGFCKIINLVNKNAPNILPLKCADVCNMGEHSWIEYIAYRKCSHLDEIKRYYVRCGEWLALLYSVNAVDIHYENIIAYGEYPIPIDLETIMHPLDRSYDSIYDNEITIPNCEIDQSVLGVGLLPHNIGDKKGDRHLDVGGMSCNKERITPFESLIIENAGTDRLCLNYGYPQLSDGSNTPFLSEIPQKAENFLEQIKQGFENMYLWIISNKNMFMTYVESVLENVNIRVIFRATYKYSQLLNTSSHPDFMTNFSNYMVFLSRIGIKDNKVYKMIHHSEVEQLKHQYVPYFIANSNKQYIEDVMGNRIENMLRVSPLRMVTEKIARLNEKDLRRQLKYINMAFSSSTLSREKDITHFEFKNVEVNKINIENWLDLAKNIGDYLIENAIEYTSKGEKGITWVSCVLLGNNEGLPQIAPVGYDVYNGNAGISLFFLYLWHLTKEEKYWKATRKSCVASCHYIDNIRKQYNYNVGLYSGLAGQLYALYMIYSLSQDDYYIKYIKKYLDEIEKNIEFDSNYDIMSGSAGALLVLKKMLMDQQIPSEELRIKKIIQLAIKHLQESITTMGDNIGWKSYGGFYSTGFAHGNAGIIAALLEVIQDDKNNIINKKEICKIIELERSLFETQNQNWFVDNRCEKIGFGWCHGAPGILLSKIPELKFFNNKKILEEMNIALKTTLNYGFGANPSLCHGDLGNLQIIHWVARMNGDKELEKQCLENFDKYSRTIMLERWKGSSFRGSEAIGLMIGTAGFGYSLLRFYCPQMVPMILYPLY